MKLDYSQITSRTFEMLAQKYLMQKYPDFRWEITPISGDGNKDILCKYKFLNQEQEYWAEAKFTKSTNPHTLSKGQLDPTLVSALLSPKPVSLCFISNNLITETYYYRLKDFKIKTNIGIELVLKDEFEDWLLRSPKLLEEYNIKVTSIIEQQINRNIKIHSAIVTDILNSNQYKTENHLIEGIIYYLYLIISSDDIIEHTQVRINSEFILPYRARLLDNPKDFCLEKGKRVYKFEIISRVVGNMDLKLQLIVNQLSVAEYSVNDITITPNQNIALSYIQQEKSLYEISCYIRESGEHNFLIPIIGDGATGKTKLIQDLYCEMNGVQNTLLLSVVGNDYLDAKLVIRMLLFFNIGDIFDCERNDIISQINTIGDERQRIYYQKLIEGFFSSPEPIVKELSEKLSVGNTCLVYPSYSRVKQIMLLDDIHKGKSDVSRILKEFVNQFVHLTNNQSVVLACREYYNDFVVDMSMLKDDWIQPYYLEGLTKEDKLATISQYFSYHEDIRFDRATDDLIVFSNILQSKLPQKEYRTKYVDPISKHVELVKAFEKPEIVNKFQYKEKLSQLKPYYNILEIIYLLNFGIDYIDIIRIFPRVDIEYLMNIKVIKRIGRNVFPYHDHYVRAYFENYKISDTSVKFIKQFWDSTKDYEEKYLYLLPLLKSGYHIYCQIEEEAHELEFHYFKITDYYKAYVIATEFKNYINFNDQLSLQELYDLMVLAVSSGYFEKPQDVKERYKQLIRIGKSIISMPDAYGIVLRAQSEIINIDYWELETLGLSEKIDSIIKQIPPLNPSSNEDLICAYLNLLNRKMVVKLMMDDFKEAEKIFRANITEIERLNRREYLGYLYMDYAKGLYNCNPTIALEYMNKAQTIFRELGTEYRRFLDCSCEIEYLKCLILKDDFSKLEAAAENLIRAQYLEIYSKAKLKLAALRLVKGNQTYSEKDIRQDLYMSEYVLDYPATGRLHLLHKMIKNAFYIAANEKDKITKLTDHDLKLTYSLGTSYQQVWNHNETGIKRSILFWSEDIMPDVYAIDARIW